MPFFSVIIPTYNRKEFLKKSVYSVLCQTEQDFELIIVDDGSTDNTQEALRSLQQQAHKKKIRYIVTKHQGVSFARNKGAQQARAEWICFLDSDDCWNSSKLTEQKKFIKENPKYRILQTQEIWIRDNKQVNPVNKYLKKEGDLFIDSLEHCFITPSTVCIQKELFNAFDGFDENLFCCEDYELWIRITAKYPVGLIRKKLAKRFAGHKDQLSYLYFAIDRFRIYSLIKAILYAGFSQEQKKLAKIMLQKKATIYIQGAKKRGRSINQFQELYHLFLTNPKYLQKKAKNLLLQELVDSLELKT